MRDVFSLIVCFVYKIKMSEVKRKIIKLECAECGSIFNNDYKQIKGRILMGFNVSVAE